LRSGDLDASPKLSEDRLSIELRRLRQPVGCWDPVFSDNYESWRSRAD